MLKTVGNPSTRYGDQTIVDGNLVIGTSGKGIDFSATSGTGTSELLADYEEGTWTPTISFSGGSAGITYSSQSGRYTRIGRQVTLLFDVRLSNKGSSSGPWEIGGFPFTPIGDGSGYLHYQYGAATITELANIRVISGNSYGTLYHAVAGLTDAYVDTDAINASICMGIITFFA